MPRLIELRPGDTMPAFAPGGAAPVDAADRARHAPDRHLLLIGDDGSLRARASVWWTQTPAIPGERVGLIGHYAATDASSAAAVLESAGTTLAQHGCTRAIGPMDGNTWRRYRWIVERGAAPPFFLEPDNPDTAPSQFAAAGFGMLATYTSAATHDLTQEDPRLAAAETRLTRQGVRIRPLDAARGHAELRAIYRLSIDAFRDNYLYTPIAEDEFLEQNARVLPYVDPELVLLAERDGDLVGYLFGVPDVLQQLRGEPVSTFIIKTVAVAGAHGVPGLGSVLVGMAQQRARERGFARAIHALMHDGNVSRNISRRYAQAIRRYALFARRLPAARA
jgi:predicted N-acetyltransferase YhbS